MEVLLDHNNVIDFGGPNSFVLTLNSYIIAVNWVDEIYYPEMTD